VQAVEFQSLVLFSRLLGNRGTYNCEKMRYMEKTVLMISEEELTEKMQKIVADVFVKAKREVEAQNADMLLSTHKVSEILDVDKSTLWRWAKAGYLVPIKIGTKTRYRKSDIEKLLSGRG